jgi:hypothetical protein
MTINNQEVLRGYMALARHLHIAPETARKLMQQPDFPVLVVTEHIRYVPIDALNQWMMAPKKTT